MVKTSLKFRNIENAIYKKAGEVETGINYLVTETI
jgi:hypothetical protein